MRGMYDKHKACGRGIYLESGCLCCCCLFVQCSFLPALSSLCLQSGRESFTTPSHGISQGMLAEYLRACWILDVYLLMSQRYRRTATDPNPPPLLSALPPRTASYTSQDDVSANFPFVERRLRTKSSSAKVQVNVLTISSGCVHDEGTEMNW